MPLRQVSDCGRRDRARQHDPPAHGAKCRPRARSPACSRSGACLCRSRCAGARVLPRRETSVIARPSRSASSGVIGSALARPRMPSVPKSFRSLISSFLTTKLQRDGWIRRQIQEQGPRGADQKRRARHHHDSARTDQRTRARQRFAHRVRHLTRHESRDSRSGRPPLLMGGATYTR